MKKIILIILALLPFGMAYSQVAKPSSKKVVTFPQAHNEQYWKKKLSPVAYQIMYEKGTEPAYHNAYYDNHVKGVYVSAATGDTLFTSETKFDSGTGWPSFFEAKNLSRVMVVKDESYGMERNEIVEAKTGLHLGHLFMDGPAPTGKRYCMNSGALKFIPNKIVSKTLTTKSKVN